MWSTKTKQFSVSGEVRRPGPEKFPGVSVDIYNVVTDSYGHYSCVKLNSVPAVTDLKGKFTFTNLSVQVKAQTVIPATPPGLPVEIVFPGSLPTLVFTVSNDLTFLDETVEVNAAWLADRPTRVHVSLTATPYITIDVTGIAIPDVPAGQFHFLRVGRVTRNEIANYGSPKAGYMNSVPPASFFPGVVDAPFGGTLQIGGAFGPGVFSDSDDVYYQLWYTPYSGNPAAPFNDALKKPITDPLFNRRYIFPVLPTYPDGKWDDMNLGPFDAQITGAGPAVVKAYQRPPQYNPLVEYYPFYDLMAVWNSTAAKDIWSPPGTAFGLIKISIEVYMKTAEVGGIKQLKPIALGASVNKDLYLTIDNRIPVPKIDKWETGFADFTPAEGFGVQFVGMDVCNQFLVVDNQLDGNECIRLMYSINDENGNPHNHLNSYNLWIEYSPKQIPGAPLSTTVNLKSHYGAGLGLDLKPLSESYSPATGPSYSVSGYETILVPSVLNGWPPETNGNTPKPCDQYAAEVSLGCSVRTIDGWGYLFGNPHISRHIIIVKV